MKHIPLYSSALFLWAVLFIACDRDEVDNVRFDVAIQNDINNIYAGDEVTFHFDGAPDYISFYSGETDNSYANKDRTNVALASLGIDYSIKQQYTDTEYRGKEILSIYISENFGGTYTPESIHKAEWTKLSGTDDNMIKVPTTVSSTAETTTGEMDLSAYKDKNFYVAIEYNAPKRASVPTADGGGRYMVAPRIDITPFTMTKETSEGQIVEMTNTKTDWGFSIVYENSEQQGTYSVGDETLLFQPQKGKEHTDDNVIVWMVSQLISPSAVSPDRGTAIKSIEAALPSYTYKYNTPGEYTATFIATNANIENAKQVVREVKFTVKPAGERAVQAE